MSLLLLVLSMLSHSLASPLSGSRPNLIFIMADDLGYGDLAAFGGNPTSETPNLDSWSMKA